MGRIEKGSEVLVDLNEAMKLLGKSRATVFRMISKGLLVKIDVGGSRKLYLTLDSIDRCKRAPGCISVADIFCNEPIEVARRRRSELAKNHPEIFTQP